MAAIGFSPGFGAGCWFEDDASAFRFWIFGIVYAVLLVPGSALLTTTTYILSSNKLLLDMLTALL